MLIKILFQFTRFLKVQNVVNIELISIQARGGGRGAYIRGGYKRVYILFTGIWAYNRGELISGAGNPYMNMYVAIHPLLPAGMLVRTLRTIFKNKKNIF